jgi:hypothetical protein
MICISLLGQFHVPADGAAVTVPVNCWSRLMCCVIQCIVGTARFCTHHFEEGTGSGFLWLTNMHHIRVTFLAH